jgi:hypothetical protein
MKKALMKMKTLTFSTPFDEDEVIQTSIRLAHEDENVVSCTPFQVFDSYDSSSCDLESDGFLEEPLDVLDPSFDGKSDDAIENIDDFIYVGRHKWDMSFLVLMEIPFMTLKVVFKQRI